jgi:hypothetical protein
MQSCLVEKAELPTFIPKIAVTGQRHKMQKGKAWATRSNWPSISMSLRETVSAKPSAWLGSDRRFS